MSDPTTPQDPAEPTTSVQGQPPHVVEAAERLDEEHRQDMARSIRSAPTHTVDPPNATTFGDPVDADALAKSGSVDGLAWATAFVQQFGGLVIAPDTVGEGDDRVIESSIHGWFANAIENGKSYVVAHPELFGLAEPLPVVETPTWDVVVNDPDMLSRHELRGVPAWSPDVAAVLAMQEAYRREGYRASAGHPPGDEQMLPLAFDFAPRWCSVHRPGQHPVIDYAAPAWAVRLTGEDDPRTNLPAVERVPVAELPPHEWRKVPVVTGATTDMLHAVALAALGSGPSSLTTWAEDPAGEDGTTRIRVERDWRHVSPDAVVALQLAEVAGAVAAELHRGEGAPAEQADRLIGAVQRARAQIAPPERPAAGEGATS